MAGLAMSRWPAAGGGLAILPRQSRFSAAAVTEVGRLQPPVAAALAVAGRQLAGCRELRAVSLQLTGSVVAPPLSSAGRAFPWPKPPLHGRLGPPHCVHLVPRVPDFPAVGRVPAASRLRRGSVDLMSARLHEELVID